MPDFDSMDNAGVSRVEESAPEPSASVPKKSPSGTSGKAAVGGILRKAGKSIKNAGNGTGAVASTITTKLKNFGSDAAAKIKSGIFGIGRFISGTVNSVASALSIPATVVSIIAIVLVVGLISSSIAIVGMVASSAYVDVTPVSGDADCKTQTTPVDVEDIVVTEEQEKVAKAIYAAFSNQGVPDVNIAGALGNLHTECGLDPTTLEGYYYDKYVMSPAKTAMADDLDYWCTSTLFPMYNNQGVNYSQPAYKASDGKYYCGIGLVQWTAGGAKKLIDTAASVGANWYDLDFQIAYMVANGAPTGRKQFKDGVKTWSTPCASPEDAAKYWAMYYEGNTVNGQASRVKYAKQWYTKMDTLKGADDSILGNLLSFIEKLGAVAESNSNAESLAKCGSASDSSDITITGSGQLGYPTKSRDVSAGFPNYPSGSYHGGIDFPVSRNTDIYAAEDGIVVTAIAITGHNGGSCTCSYCGDGLHSYGRYIIIEHEGGLQTLYAHNSKLLVSPGDTVKRGQVIAKSGSSGNSSGPHCHFEVRLGGNRVNPNLYLNEAEAGEI